MDYTKCIPVEIIEQICLALADDPLPMSLMTTIPSSSTLLSALPLINSRWHLSGQKALYRHIVLETADQYKCFQDCLTLHPGNGIYIRSIAIDWGFKDFGGPDGYSYKVLGWFHEMEIQQVVRLCPFLESFYPAQYAPVISREGIAALGTIGSMRCIHWRAVDVKQYGDTILQAHSNWKQLEEVELWDIFSFIGAVSRRIGEDSESSFLSDIRYLLMRIR